MAERKVACCGPTCKAPTIIRLLHYRIGDLSFCSPECVDIWLQLIDKEFDWKAVNERYAELHAKPNEATP